MKKILTVLILCFGLFAQAVAQDGTDSAKNEAPARKFARATFNSTKIINMQSVEIVSKGSLQFLISHHLSYLWNKDAGSQNVAQFFGLNSGVAHTYMSFDYSPLKFMNVGVALAGSSQYEGFLKFRILRQQTGLKNIPVSVAWYSMMHINTAKDPDVEFTANKLAFMNQLLIARKFSNKFSLQLMPTWIHFNVVPYGINNSNEVFSLGIAGKYKATSKLNITLEYARQLNMYENLISKNGAIVNYHPDLLSAGIELNTGNHLFQFYIGSTTDGSAIDQLARNNSRIKDGNFAFGFTINRTMSIKK
ncbi:MAG: hypothetical protein IPP96_02910 [Chitinophagaceae bacterium]|nr:hypothetical protein [Chitinophagaceae bacterium]